jgi:uncharacterized sodium:solute symporter family permease YidK
MDRCVIIREAHSHVIYTVIKAARLVYNPANKVSRKVHLNFTTIEEISANEGIKGCSFGIFGGLRAMALSPFAH